VFDPATINQPTIAGPTSVLGIDFRTDGWQINGTGNMLTIGTGGLTSTSTGGTNTINTDVTLGGSQTWTTSAGNTVVVNGLVTFGGNTLTKDGAGALTLGTTAQTTSYAPGSALQVNAGTVNLNSVGGDNTHRNLSVAVNNATLKVGSTQYLAALALTNSAKASINAINTSATVGTIKTDNLSIDTTSLLDLQTNNLIVNYTGGGTTMLTAVMNLVKSGGGTKSDGNHFDWNGTSGVTTSTPNLMGTAKNSLSLGIRDFGFPLANRPAPATIEGVEVESDTSGGAASVVVKYTWMGDTHLDGKVTVNDYLEFLHYYAAPPAAADITWMTGDFNYDGRINVNDYLLLLAGYKNQTATLSADEQVPASLLSEGLSAVPEPATLVLLAAGSILALRRRGRKA